MNVSAKGEDGYDNAKNRTKSISEKSVKKKLNFKNIWLHIAGVICEGGSSLLVGCHDTVIQF